MTQVLFVNAVVAVALAALMGACGLVFHDTQGAMLEAMLDAGIAGALIALATWRRHPPHMRRSHTFLLTASVWMTASIVGGLPLWHYGLSPADAFFEAISGLTTTGSTVMSGLDTTPHGILMWRALLQGVGGVGFIVTGIALLPFLRIGGMQLFQTESSEKGGSEMAGAARFAAATLWVYLGLIVLCGVVYALGGMSPFDAAVHALTTLSSGGYSNYDASFGHFDSAFLQWACTFFMLAAGLPFAWYIRILTRGTWISEQVRAMVISITITIVLLSLWLEFTADLPPLTALRMVAFNVISVVTTTGYATADYTLWGGFAVVIFFLLTAIGGCTGSTAGGVKAMRWIILAREIQVRLREVLLPHNVSVLRYEGRPVGDDVLGGVMGFFSAFFITFSILAVLLTMIGLDFQTAISGSLTALANVGPGIGPVIGPAGNFASLSDLAKVLLGIGMYLGRLEMLTVFVLLTPVFWREV